MTILDILANLFNVAAVGFLAYGCFTVINNSSALIRIAASRFEHRTARSSVRHA